MQNPAPPPPPSSLETRRAPLPLEDTGSSIPPPSVGIFSLCFRLRLKAWSNLFPGEKGWFPEAAVGQTGGEGKKGRLGEGHLEDCIRLRLLGPALCPGPEGVARLPRATFISCTCVRHRCMSSGVWYTQPIAAGPGWLVLSTSHIAKRCPHIPHSCLLQEVVCRALLNIKV